MSTSSPSRRRLPRLAAGLAAGALALLPAAVGTAGAGPSHQRFDPPGDLVANPHDTCMGRKVTIKAVGPPVIGTPGSDVIAGTDGPDVLYGKGGDDIICGFDGDDIIFGDDADPADPEGGLDTINGGMGDDDIFGGPRQDFLQGSAGNDDVWGDLPGTVHGFTDTIQGGNGHDHLYGGPGADDVWGDRKDGGFGHDVIDTTTDDPIGGDHVWAGRGNDGILAENGTGQHVEGQAGTDICLVDEAIDTRATCETVL